MDLLDVIPHHSTFFDILVNGSPSSTFSPSHGIRQGDPLSLFIFILMVEGLGRMLQVAISSSSLCGLTLHGVPPWPIINSSMTTFYLGILWSKKLSLSNPYLVLSINPLAPPLTWRSPRSFYSTRMLPPIKI